MSEPTPETADVPAQPYQGDPAPPAEPEPETPDNGEEKSDQEQGVGVAPTHAGDTEDGEGGTQFQTTAEVESTGEKSDDTAEHI